MPRLGFAAEVKGSEVNLNGAELEVISPLTERTLTKRACVVACVRL